MANIVWVNIEDSHFKVWGFDFFVSDDSCEVITYWGRIGTPMHRLQKNRKQFTKRGDAFDYVRNKVEEKRCKGYKEMPNHKYFSYLHDDKPLSKLIRTIEAIPA